MVVLVGGVWLLAIPFSPQPILETGTVIDVYREQGLVPEVGEISFAEELEDVFELPARDQEELKKAASQLSGQMAGQMGGAPMDNTAMGNTAMGTTMPPKDMSEMPAQDMSDSPMGMADGLTVLANGTAAEVSAVLASTGVKVDSEAVIDLKEWSVGSGTTVIKPGQTMRLKVVNSGNIPHEFMIMRQDAMQAVLYRMNRPDWNLTEHKATTEIPFLMPGDSLEIVIKVTKPGMWMYMCMFPYHMQLGMMGALVTPDMMGQMNNMNPEMDLFMPKI